ncbi:Alg9-like mannosyltransferase family-domain-containing protein [Neohortaea acidophila]|uniref:Mannosyltransferase n=1 Tax=Neohortaea acidophila TaxID=245834 RepID=A0A6A6Q4S8_9PEZI|nr:Alg9-like mannosyltransferase family-domain-containing protein [Neohortaea acidophila]KAF2487004.1 Alg9-like mannosyltransferase family-domain-containing protein [Neohortaea acidophila]
MADTAARPAQPAPSAPAKDAANTVPSKAVTFAIFFASHIIAALYHPIQDCDEVFNFWEPTHYFNHGNGFQTWEYSPAYAIRSWAYTGLHALIIFLASPLAGVFGGKVAEFYLLRIFLAAVCALAETRLFSKIAAILNPRIAITFLIVMTTSPGMFHASIAYLPSSFAMYMAMFGVAAFMDWRGGLRTAEAIAYFGAGTVLGWPFAAALIIPFLAEEAAIAWVADEEAQYAFLDRVWNGLIRASMVLATQAVTDNFFYKHLEVVPFNIIRYNIFSAKGGPNLYGTEAWHFYLRNLFLNFHVWFLLALLAMPLMLLQQSLRAKGATKTSHLRGLVFLSPFYLWLAIFTLQPHKEERFMYPAYPLLALNAAVALHIILANFGSSDPKHAISKIPVQLRLTAILLFVVASLAVSASRTIGTISAYNAPLSIYKPLHDTNIARPGSLVCLGKEWYRFPSHYLLPDNVRAKLIKSSFSGLLPGEFHEAQPGAALGIFPGTFMEPSGMNDENREDPSKYTDIKHCDFVVDLRLPSTPATTQEPDFISDRETWERVKCLPFLDAAGTSTLGRLGWLPDSPLVPEQHRRVWGKYCLLKRRRGHGKGEKGGLPHIEVLS